ncbi:MAG: MaoC family dehydratase N-terminal domain-containing protein [Actinomycetota bacterium]
MNLDTLGQVLVETELVVDPVRLELLAAAIGTDTAAETAARVPFFGPTAAGQDSVIGPLDMDLRRALQGGQSYEWHRSFVPGETVQLRITIEDILDKGAMQLATVLSEYRDTTGALIQRQRTVFVEQSETTQEHGVEQSETTQEHGVEQSETT